MALASSPHVSGSSSDISTYSMSSIFHDNFCGTARLRVLMVFVSGCAMAGTGSAMSSLVVVDPPSLPTFAMENISTPAKLPGSAGAPNTATPVERKLCLRKIPFCVNTGLHMWLNSAIYSVTTIHFSSFFMAPGPNASLWFPTQRYRRQAILLSPVMPNKLSVADGAFVPQVVTLFVLHKLPALADICAVMAPGPYDKASVLQVSPKATVTVSGTSKKLYNFQLLPLCPLLPTPHRLIITAAFYLS